MKEKLYWTTREGKKIDVDELTIEHLRNIVKMIVRNMQDQKDAMLAEEFNDLYPAQDSGFWFYEDYK